MKVVIVGGVAGGASAAARIRRLDEHAQIIMIERSGYMSYANCGLPYYVGGVIVDRDELTLQTPESFWDRFRIDNEFEKEVRLVGHGNKYAMVRKALQRNGILASRRVESDFYIETGDMTTNGYIIHPVAGRTIKVDTIEELLEQVTAILASV